MKCPKQKCLNNMEVIILKRIITCIFLSLLMATAVLGDTAIKVTVDGSQVQFGAVGPQSVQGRVLVPLRGVLEKVGAFVGWDPVARQVIAQKGSRDVVLKVGDKNATVNGQTVVMDVPAIIYAGTTMVPLRFLGEALGAEIKWNGPDKTVEIFTGDEGSVTETTAPGSPTDPELISFSHDATGWLKAEDVIKVTLVGTPKAKASFMIPGVVGQVPMTETKPGTYTGQWKVTANTAGISEGSVIGTLAIGEKSKLIQAASHVRIDVTPPVVRNLNPADGTDAGQSKLSISAVWDDANGSGIDIDSAVLKINGKDYSADASTTQSFINYRPESPLPAGEVNVYLSVADKAGNKTEKTWKFNLINTAGIIKSFTYAAADIPAPGDEITATLEGKPGGTASFWFVDPAGNKLRTQAMKETSPGIYTGEYTVRKTDDLSGAEVVGSLVLPSGSSYTLPAEKKIGGTASTPNEPVILSPAANSKVASPITVTGKAPGNSQVQLKVEYSTLWLGPISMKGTLAEQVVDVDDDGEFSSKPIDLSTAIGKGKDTTYTLTAVTLSGSGMKSEPVVIKFTKQ